MKTPSSKDKSTTTTTTTNELIIESKMSSPSMKHTRRTSPLPLCCMIALQIGLVWVATIGPRTSDASYAGSNYDPEQPEGIPILSARSLNPLPADDWLNGDSDNERLALVGGRHLLPARAQRRSSDSDLDDGVDDDDDDEYQSGSSKHELVEPSFGESKRAAKDGEEIESFFDKHLGPPAEVGSGEEASEEVPIQSIPTAEAAHVVTRPTRAASLSATTSDPDDYEASASSPLSSIFQSLLGAHRKPFVIHATEEVDSSSSSSKSERPDGKEPAAQANPLGSSSSLQGSAMAANHYMQQVAPIAFQLTPMASPSSIDSYESVANGGGQPDDVQQAPVREIYIGRRPAVAKYIQQASGAGGAYSASNSRGIYGGGGQASGQVWRNTPMMYAAHGGRPQVDQSDYQQSMDYSRYPVAASYAYQREQAQPGEPATPDDGQTVTYGLSFGGSSAADEANDSEPAGGDSAAASSPANQGDDEAGQQQAAGYMPYNDREFMRYKTASTRAYNNYQNGAMNVPMGYLRVPQNHPAYIYQQRQYQQLQQRQQSPYHGSRYHRDPSEAQLVGVIRGNPHQPHLNAAAAAAGSAQSFSGDTSNHNRDESMETRQQLLANLNEQIRASPYYRQDAMTRRPVKQMTTSQTINRGMLNNDLDTYDSYHSEVDPYKTFTTTSKMVRYPSNALPSNVDNNNINDHYNNVNPVGSGSTRIPANVDGNQSQGQQQQQHEEHQNDHNNQSRNQQLPQTTGNQTDSRIDSSRDLESNHKAVGNNEQPPVNNGNSVLTGPITNYDSSSETPPLSQDGDLMRNNNNGKGLGRANLRVRREDSEDRSDDADDDDDGGVWVDDDEDDNKQQSSDVNETSQEPEEEDNQGQNDLDQNNQVVQISPPGVIGAPHGYELSPNDLMIYHG